jgi:KDO2-lipid IV(A) lauroyltransferase
MAGDQNSTNMKRSYWVDFFGIKTACLPGIENYAKLFDLPVIFMEIRRVKRGYYRCYVSMIVEDPSKCEKGEITQKYMSKLEEVMRNQPETWLWSHKRWKTALQPDGTVTSSGFYDNL